MKKTIMMVILTILISGAVKAENFPLSQEEAVKMAQTYATLKYDASWVGNDASKKKFHNFLKERFRVCGEHVKKLSPERCKEEWPTYTDEETSECQDELLKWLLKQPGCDFIEFRR